MKSASFRSSPRHPVVYPPRPTAVIVCARVQTLVSSDIKKIKIKREKGYGFSGCVFLGDDIRPRARIINSRRPVYATFLYRTYIVCTRAPQCPHGPPRGLEGGWWFSGIYIYSTNVYMIDEQFLQTVKNNLSPLRNANRITLPGNRDDERATHDTILYTATQLYRTISLFSPPPPPPPPHDPKRVFNSYRFVLSN